MAVNFPNITADQLTPVAGIELGFAQAGIRKADRKDLLVIRLSEGASVSGVFTTNTFCAAPVDVCRRRVVINSGGRAVIVNTGCANAGTGEQGLRDAETTCGELANLLNITDSQVLPFSTGVILEHLPMDKLIGGLPDAIANLTEDNWYNAAQAIMTTDTVAKTVAVTRSGAGMIKPNMATMLGFIGTDALVPQADLDAMMRRIADQSFNCITIDGDTSTNDSFIVMASGASDVACKAGSVEFSQLEAGLVAVAQELAQLIVRDGEGATKFIRIAVEKAASVAEARTVAYSVAHSPLVKTAFFASDPNLGRILAAIGYAQVDGLDVNAIDVYLDDIHVATAGGRHPSYTEEQGQAVMNQAEITVRIVLNRGSANANVWTCDLSHDYVSINADYRS
mgnify:CR=1 FL=1